MQQKNYNKYIQSLKYALANHFHIFLALWLIWSFIPIAFLKIYEVLLPELVRSSESHGLTTVYVAMGLIVIFLCVSLGFSLWACFLSGIQSSKKIIIILNAYFILWLAFTNIYYFFNCIDDYFILAKVATEDSDIIHMNGLKPFWHAVSMQGVHNLLLPINRFYNYVGCLFYSADTMSTIGSNDMVTSTTPGRILTMIEAFAGQVVTIVAIGMFFSNRGDK